MNVHLLLASQFYQQSTETPATMNFDTDYTPLMPSSRSYIKVGLGGGGNYTPSYRTNDAPIPSPPRTNLGGTGKKADSRSRAALNDQAEQERNALCRTSAATYGPHGIGGAGNRDSSEGGSSTTSSLSEASSLKSGGKVESKGAANRLKEVIVEKWERRNRRASLFQTWQKKLPVIDKGPAEVRSAESFEGSAV